MWFDYKRKRVAGFWLIMDGRLFFCSCCFSVSVLNFFPSSTSSSSSSSSLLLTQLTYCNFLSSTLSVSHTDPTQASPPKKKWPLLLLCSLSYQWLVVCSRVVESSYYCSGDYIITIILLLFYLFAFFGVGLLLLFLSSDDYYGLPHHDHYYYSLSPVLHHWNIINKTKKNTHTRRNIQSKDKEEKKWGKCR